MRLTLVTACVLVALPATISGQNVALNALSLQSGVHARILGPASDAKYMVITVASASPDTLRYSLVPNVEKSLSWQRIDRMDVSTGRHRHFWRGAGIGLLGGMTAGVIAGAQEKGEMRGLYTVSGGIVGGAFGAIVGGVLGLAYASENWRPVTLPGR
ncbi:MAG: hypothetical protein ACJ78D_10860 [Gemmatimonadaceae bacterium]